MSLDDWWHFAPLGIDRVSWRTMWRPWQGMWLTEMRWCSYSGPEWVPGPAMVSTRQPSEADVLEAVTEWRAREDRGVDVAGGSIAEQRSIDRMLAQGWIRNDNGSWSSFR